MLVSEALQSINSFPIPDLTIQKIGVDRGLDVTTEYTSAVSISEEFELATADIYMWLYGQPSFGEQEISVSQQEKIKQGFFDIANGIYNKYGDPKATGGKYGFTGDKWNG